MIIKRLVQIIFFVYCLSACKGQSVKEENCAQKFKLARELAYVNPDSKTALDSALFITNEITQCESIRKDVVDFKITLLINLKRYQQALTFIDSLNPSDFTYNYKKNTTYKSVLALIYDSQDDKVRRDSVYKSVSCEIEKYIENKSPSGKEFNAVYTELFAIKGIYSNPNQIDSVVELLKKRYPDKETFFDFFKSRKNEQ